MSAQPQVVADASPRYPRIPQAQRGQADLYASAFAAELLAQDYRRPRGELLSWVQSESVASTEPTVVGLVPEGLRSKLAVYSLTSATDGSATPIPSAPDWAAWARIEGYSTVAIQKVTEPPTWAQAVNAGALTDPGVTARDVDALVTTHWRSGGAPRTSIRSVSISLTLEGPPSRLEFGFVSAVSYRSVAVG